ncbi:hypothetical protein [Streptomyces sp. NPDC058623]|uniref:hypothetical protein n=1 Tax=Streptomyces sp. NPDC058623 TaxID=3346563 RepID=UPI003647027F
MLIALLLPRREVLGLPLQPFLKQLIGRCQRHLFDFELADLLHLGGQLVGEPATRGLRVGVQ